MLFRKHIRRATIGPTVPQRNAIRKYFRWWADRSLILYAGTVYGMVIIILFSQVTASIKNNNDNIIKTIALDRGVLSGRHILTKTYLFIVVYIH